MDPRRDSPQCLETLHEARITRLCFTERENFRQYSPAVDEPLLCDECTGA